MAAEFGVVHPLWDYAADSGRLLEHTAGDVGIDHVTVPVVSGARVEFRPALSREAPHFHTEGGWHYRVGAGGYAGVALKPAKARWFAGGDLLAQVRARLAELNVRLLLRVDVRAVRALVDQERHLCQRNAWGQEVPFAGACACNPDLRELVRATLDDLRRYEPAGFELVDWAPDSPADRGPSRPLGWQPAARQRLDVCFCASCRQVAESAGVDADQAARSVRASIEQLLTSPASDSSAAGDSSARSGPGECGRLARSAATAGDMEWRNGPVEADPVLAAYFAARAKDCCQWLARLVEGDADRRWYLLRAVDVPPLGNVAPWVRMGRIPATTASGADAGAGSESRAGLAQVSALALPAWRPAFVDAADLVRYVHEAARTGVKTFDIEGLGEAAPEAIVWLKQAARFARRG